MKSKMKSAFAIIAVALMIMVAVVPMAAVFTEKDASATATPTPSPDAPGKGITVNVVDASNPAQALPYAKIMVSGTAYTAKADGTLKLAWADVKGKTITAQMPGFSFGSQNIVIGNNVVSTDPDQSVTFKSAETLVTVTSKVASYGGEKTLSDGKINYGSAATSTGSTVDIYTGGVSYVPKKTTDASVFVKISSGAVTIDGREYTSLASATATELANTTGDVTADQTIVAITVQDYNSGKIKVAPTGVSITKGTTTTTVSTVGTNKYVAGTDNTDAMIYAAFVIPAGDAEASNNGYRVTPTVAGYSFTLPDAAATTATYVAKANETNYTFKVQSLNNVDFMNGTVSVSYTFNGSKTATANPDGQGNFVVALPSGATAINLNLSGVKDDAGNSLTYDVNPVTAATVGDLTTYHAKENAFVVSGTFFYNNATTPITGVDGITIKVANGRDGYKSADGTYSLVIVEGKEGTLKTTAPKYLESIIVSENIKVLGDYTRNFVAEQNEKADINLTLKNTKGTNVGSGDVTVKLLDASEATPTTVRATLVYDANNKYYEADNNLLTRGEKYAVAVYDGGDNIFALKAAVTIDLTSSSLNVVTSDATVADVTVTGYIYGKWVSDDVNNRPMVTSSGNTITIGGKSITTDENGRYSIEVAFGENLPVIANGFGIAAGKYWSGVLTMVDAKTDLYQDIEMTVVSYDIVGYVYAKKYTANAEFVGVTPTEVKVKVNGTDIAANSITYRNGTFAFNLPQTVVAPLTIVVSSIKSTGFTFVEHAAGDWTFEIANPSTVAGSNKIGDTNHEMVAEEEAIDGTVLSLNGFGYDGSITLTSSPNTSGAYYPGSTSAVSFKLAIDGGNFRIPVTVKDVVNPTTQQVTTKFQGVQQLFKITELKDAKGNDLTIKSDYALTYFRISITPNETAGQNGTFSVGTIATDADPSVDGQWITKVDNVLNLVTADYVFSGTVKYNDATVDPAVDRPVANLGLDFTWSYGATPSTAKVQTVTETDGSYYALVSPSMTGYVATMDTALTVALTSTAAWSIFTINGQEAWNLTLADGDALAIIVKERGVTLTLKDAFNKNIDGVTASLYKSGEAAVVGTITFVNGQASYTAATSPATFVVKLDSTVYTIATINGQAQPATGVVFTDGTTLAIITNEGTATGKVKDVSGNDAKISGTLILTANAKDYTMTVTDGAYSGVIYKADITSAYLKGGDYALLKNSSGTTLDGEADITITNAGVVGDLEADSRIIAGTLKDGQGYVIPDVAIEVTAAAKKLTAIVGDDGKYELALLDKMPVQSYAVTAILKEGSRDLGYSLNEANDDIAYTAATTGKVSTFKADLKTNENMMVITFVDEDKEPISGLVVDAVTTIPNEITNPLYEEFIVVSDDEGKIVIHSARAATHVYGLSNALFGTLYYGENPANVAFYENKTVTLAATAVSAYAYYEAEVVAPLADLEFKLADGQGNPVGDVVLTTVTDEDGMFTVIVPKSTQRYWVGSDYLFDNNVNVYFKNATHNVDAYWAIEDVEFNAAKLTVNVGYRTIDPQDPESAAMVSGVLVNKFDHVFYITTGIDGSVEFYVPQDDADDDVEYSLIIDGVVYSKMDGEVDDNELIFLTNEYRLYVPVAFDGHAIDGAVVEGSNEGVLYYIEFDASAGIAVIDGIEIGDYLRAVADGYEFDAVIDGVLFDQGYAQFDGDSIAFVGSLIVYTYTYEVDFGENTILSKYVDIRADDFKLQLTLLVADPREEISVDVYDVTNHVNLVKKFEFQGWNVNGELIKDANTAIYYAEDPMTLSYLVAPMFKETTEDVSPVEPEPPTPPEPVTPSNEIDQNILILGIVAVIIAVLSVILVLIKVLFIDGRKSKEDKPVEQKKEEPKVEGPKEA